MTRFSVHKALRGKHILYRLTRRTNTGAIVAYEKLYAVWEPRRLVAADLRVIRAELATWVRLANG